MKSAIDRATRKAAAKRRDEARALASPSPETFDFLEDLPNHGRVEPLPMTEGPVKGLVGRVKEAAARRSRTRAQEGDRVAQKRAKAEGVAPPVRTYRATNEEVEDWERAAGREPLSTWIRRVCNEAAKGGR